MAKYRMTIDLRSVNATKVKESWPMPHLESELLDFSGSKCFASLYVVSGYWQLPLDSHDACCIVTPRGFYTSKRVLQGLANSVAHLRRTIDPLFVDLREHIKICIDDFFAHAPNEPSLLDTLEHFLRICHKHGLWLSARKSSLFRKEIRWCGRLISGDGYQMNPTHLSGLKDMPVPTTAGEVSQFIYCCRWMSNPIPDFARCIGPLNEVLEKAFSKSGRRTKRSIQKLVLRTLSWGPTHEQLFLDIQDRLRSAVKLSYPVPDKVICIFTDELDRYWSDGFAQSDGDQLKLPLRQQRPETHAFPGSKFKAAAKNWSTFEKRLLPSSRLLSNLTTCFWVIRQRTCSLIIGTYFSSSIHWRLSLHSCDTLFLNFRGGLCTFQDLVTSLSTSLVRTMSSPTSSHAGHAATVVKRDYCVT